jgi:4-hydroxyphenylacetate 3-monooxygenase
MPSSIRRSIATGRRTKSATFAVHVEQETDAGIVVSGAKVVATGSVLTQLYVRRPPRPDPGAGQEISPLVFMVPTNARRA